MQCWNCGEEVNVNAVVCVHCGCSLKKMRRKDRYLSNGDNQSWLGVVMAIFLPIIGLIIGLLLYPADSYERETFWRGWWITMVVLILVGLAIVLLSVGCISCLACLSEM